jgi:hypothetical protein
VDPFALRLMPILYTVFAVSRILGWLVVRRGLGIGAPLYTSYTLPMLGTFLIWMALAWSRLAWQMEAPIIKRTRDEADAPASGDGE